MRGNEGLKHSQTGLKVPQISVSNTSEHLDRPTLWRVNVKYIKLIKQEQ